MASLGKYQLVRKLAAGGMAEVYLARTEGPAGFSKTLVIKRILPHLVEHTEFVDMFLNEARLAALLNHPNVIQIFELGEEQGTYYLAMELVDGTNLRSLARAAHAQGQRLPVDAVCKILSLACEGLAYAHEFVDESGRALELVHRDVSPDNILLSRQGSVKVADFGIAKAANLPNVTKTGMLKGKINYMPPEQLRALPLDRRADVFALGVVLHEALAGGKPFDNSSDVSAMQSILNEAPRRLAELRPELPEALQVVVDKALSKDRDQRYPDCRALQADLEKLLAARGALVRAVDLAALVNTYCPPQARISQPELPVAPASAEIPLELSLQKSLLFEEAEVVVEEAPVPLSEPPRKPEPPVREPTGVTQVEISERVQRAAPPASRAPLWVVLGVLGGGGLAAAGFAFGHRPAPVPVVAPAPAVVEVRPPPVAAPMVVEPARPAPAPVAAAVVEVPRPAPAPEKHPDRPAHPRHEPPTPSASPTPAEPTPAPELKPTPAVAVVPKPAPAPVVAAPEGSKPGTLALRVKPWAEVEIDGHPYGVTPMAPVTLMAGEHTVRLKNAAMHADQTHTVSIHSGAPETLRVDLTAP